MELNMTELFTAENDAHLNIVGINEKMINGWNEYFNNALSINTENIVCVHNGLFHADDCMAMAIMLIAMKHCDSKLSVIRTRDEEILSDATFCLDVSGSFDPEHGKLDHHQRGGSGTFWKTMEEEIPMASCGLAWSFAGLQAIKNILTSNNKDVAHLERIWVKLLPTMFGIDATDVGRSDALGIYTGVTLPSFVSSFNVLEDAYTAKEQQHMQFEKIVNMLVEHIVRCVLREYASAQFETECENAYSEMNEYGIMVLSVGGDWRSWMLRNWERTQRVRVVVFPSGDSWRIQTAPGSKANPMLMRCGAPMAIRGLRDDELNTYLHNEGIECNATFIHPNGFMGGASTLEDAAVLAKYWVRNTPPATAA